MNSRLAIATHILGILAFRQREQRQPITSEQLAESIGTNPVVVRRILSQLKTAGLVDSRRGVGGGTVLARDPRHIHLRHAYEAVHEDDSFVLGRHDAALHDACGVGPIIADYLGTVCGAAEEAMLKRLEAVNIHDMAEHVVERMKRRPGSDSKRAKG